MFANYKTIRNATFPVFVLPSDNWDSQDRLLFVEGRLLDDRNMPSGTLGGRRLQTPMRGLLPLRKAVLNHAGLLKSGKKYFIDSLGKCFIYEKTKFCKLHYSKIVKIDHKGIASLIWVKGIDFPFTVPRPPEYGFNHAGVLYLNNLPWLLYEYANDKLPSSKRKV
jgi:hypothetical protein